MLFGMTRIVEDGGVERREDGVTEQERKQTLNTVGGI